MTLQQPNYDATPIFCEQFAAFLDIGTYISFKKEGDQRKEVGGFGLYSSHLHIKTL